MASGAGAEYVDRERWAHAGGGGILRQRKAADAGSEEDDRNLCDEDERSGAEEEPGCRALGTRCDLGGVENVAGVAADDQHRRAGGRVYGAGRKDRAAAPCGGEDRYAAGAGHDGGRYPGETEGSPGAARVRRHRGEYERRV